LKLPTNITENVDLYHFM
jgi:hypothetical protein